VDRRGAGAAAGAGAGAGAGGTARSTTAVDGATGCNDAATVGALVVSGSVVVGSVVTIVPGAVAMGTVAGVGAITDGVAGDAVGGSTTCGSAPLVASADCCARAATPRAVMMPSIAVVDAPTATILALTAGDGRRRR
jgi:hypothetical protein